MNTSALYVYEPIEFDIQGVVEPLLLASGQPAGGQISDDAVLAPGLYRLPASTELIAMNASDSQNYDIQDLGAPSATPNDSGRKGDGPGDPPTRALAMLGQQGESPDATKARLIAIVNGLGAQTKLTVAK